MQIGYVFSAPGTPNPALSAKARIFSLSDTNAGINNDAKSSLNQDSVALPAFSSSTD
jgi:hypothetical protein